MKQLEKKDLVDGEIYKASDTRLTFIIKATKNLKNVINIPSYNAFMKSGNFNNSYLTFSQATPEEKHWLEVCIAANRFISYEEAMKTFIPEYVELLHGGCRINSEPTIGKIYKIYKDPNKSYYGYGFLLDNEYKIGFHKDQFNMYLKPSTKEAYDAQFVVKEPEFVLPERWCIKRNKENYKIINNYFKNKFSFLLPPSLKSDYIGYNIENWSTFVNKNDEITFEQFKKYVLKEQLEEPKDKVLEKEGIDLNIGKIIRVESSEGAIYQLDDKVVVFDKSNPNNNKPCTIIGFRWTNDKKEICAITTSHQGLGIRLSKIELYSEPVVKELSLLEQAKLKYPIGTKFKVVHLSTMILTVKNHEDYYFQTDKIVNLNVEENINGCTGGSVYYKGKWAEIVEDFKLPEAWWITIKNEKQLEITKQYFRQHFNSLSALLVGGTIGYFPNRGFMEYAYHLTNRTKQNNPQITFKQFEQHVLHSGFKVGDRFNKVKSLSFPGRFNNVTEIEIIDLQYINNESVAFYKIIETGYSGPQCRILTKNIAK